MIEDEVTAADCIELARSIRRQDVAEISAGSGMEPLQSLLFSLSVSCISRAFRARSGKLMAVAGVAKPTRRTHASPWLLGTAHIKSDPVEFMRDARAFVTAIPAKLYPLASFTPPDSIDSHRWLRSLGFTVDSRPVVVNGSQWLKFSMEAPRV